MQVWLTIYYVVQNELNTIVARSGDFLVVHGGLESDVNLRLLYRK